MRFDKVLLIGGSGFLGGWLAGRLAERGIRIVVPTRDAGRARWLTPIPAAELVVADVHDPQILSRLMSGVDAVVNLVGILHDRDARPPYGQVFAKAHVELPGKIVAAPAKAGDTVAKGQPVVVLEAMKMEHALTAPFDGVVAEFNVAVGDQVVDGAVLAVVKAGSEG